MSSLNPTSSVLPTDVSTDYTIQTIDGVKYRVFADGRKVKEPGKAVRTGDQSSTSLVGAGPKRGEAGYGQGPAGANIFKAQATEHIVNQRGPGGGSNPNGWDEGDIGWWARSQGVTIQDLQNLSNTNLMNNPDFVSQNNQALIAAGVLNTDGSQRTVQFGDTQSSLDELVARATKRGDEINAADIATSNIQNDIVQRNVSNESSNAVRAANVDDAKTLAGEREEVRELESIEAQRGRDFQIGMQELKNDAEMSRYEKELERYDRRERRDSIAALIAGLTTLGIGFTA